MENEMFTPEPIVKYKTAISCRTVFWLIQDKEYDLLLFFSNMLRHYKERSFTEDHLRIYARGRIELKGLLKRLLKHELLTYAGEDTYIINEETYLREKQ